MNFLSPKHFGIGLLVALFFTTLPTQYTLAEPTPLNLENSVSSLVVPSSPGMFDDVTIKLQSFSIDLNQADIAWFVDDKFMQMETGGIFFSFRTKGIGDPVRIEAVIDMGIFGNITKTYVFNPAKVDFLWQAIDSYTPPFYKGKALPAPEAEIKVVAIPTTNADYTKSRNPKALVYQWEKNYSNTPFLNRSGYGKNSVTFKRNMLRAEESVGVRVYSGDVTLGYEEIIFSQYEPEIVFYENKALDGVWYERAIGDNLNLQSRETTILPEPYYFSTEKRTSRNIKAYWFLNKERLNSRENTDGSITLRVADGNSDTWNLSIRIENLSSILQNVTARLSLSAEDLSNPFIGQ